LPKFGQHKAQITEGERIIAANKSMDETVVGTENEIAVVTAMFQSAVG
jgi:hypothetical protein